MVHDWAEAGISCEDCARRPALKDCLGCGYPPKRDDIGPPRWLWSPDTKTQETCSPLDHVQAGRPPYQQMGYGDVRVDWEWCPIWFSAFSPVTVGGEPPHVFVARAYRYRDKGELASLVRPPWTASLVDLVDFYDRLEVEAKRIRDQQREAEREMEKARRASHR